MSEPATTLPERCDCGLEYGHDESCGAANALIELRRENEFLRDLLSRTYDRMVPAMQDIIGTYQRIGQYKQRLRRKAAGSCVTCGIECSPKGTRCNRCARVNAAGARRRAALAKETPELCSTERNSK